MGYLSGYTKYKVLTLTGGADGALTDFQLKLAVSYEAAMDGEFDDLRFTQADGTTLIDAWAEVIVTDTSATVWVEFPTTPANTVEQTYYMYYDHATPVSDWDGAATFAQYYAGGSIGSSTNLYPNNSLSFATNDYAMRTRSKTSNINGDRARLCIMAGSSSLPYESPACAISVYGGDFVTMPESDIYATSPDTDYHIFDLYGTTSSINARIDDNEIEIQTTNIPTPFYMAYRVDGGATPNVTLTIDWGFIRKYAANPPTYVFGAEQSVPAVEGNPYWYYNLLKRRN